MASVVCQSVKLRAGSMPIVGLGTWKSKPGQVESAVYHAIANGYRHIDCAMVYGNEPEVGNAIKRALQENICAREDLFVTSKLWSTFHRASDVRGAFDTTLTNLQLEYLDLYLIHWPTNFLAGQGTLFPKDEGGMMLYDPEEFDFHQTWPEMEKLVQEGLVKDIGVSNFNTIQMGEIMENCTVPISVNQIECHPYCTQETIKAYCDDNDIVITAYSPLGSPDRMWATEEDPVLMDDSTIQAIAVKYDKSVAQILIRFSIERGIPVIPKSVTPSRIEQNYESLAFNLEAEDMATLMALNRNWHAVVPRIRNANGEVVPRDSAHPQFPFGKEEEFCM